MDTKARDEKYQLLISQLNDDIDDALSELLEFAKIEDEKGEILNKQSSSPKSSLKQNHHPIKVGDFLKVAQSSTDSQRMLKEYVFEILKAYGCSSHMLEIDQIDSVDAMRKITSVYPQFVWVRDFYKRNVDLDELNPKLANDKDLFGKAQEKLDQWLNK